MLGLGRELVPILGNEDTKDTKDASGYISYSGLGYVYIEGTWIVKGDLYLLT